MHSANAAFECIDFCWGDTDTHKHKHTSTHLSKASASALRQQTERQQSIHLDRETAAVHPLTQTACYPESIIWMGPRYRKLSAFNPFLTKRLMSYRKLLGFSQYKIFWICSQYSCLCWYIFMAGKIHSDAHFELQQIILTMSTGLNASSCCQVIGWLDICINK